MLTGFQLRNDDTLNCYMVYGKIEKSEKNEVGDIAYVEDDTLVLYVIKQRRKVVAWLVKTDVKNGISSVPGIHKPVEVLCEVRGPKKLQRLIDSLKYYHHNMDKISDLSCFLNRVQAIVKVKNFSRKNIVDLHKRCNGFSQLE